MSAPFEPLDDGEPRSNSKEDVGGTIGFSHDATRTRPGRAPVTFAIPQGSVAKPCRSCKALIHWIEHPRTKSRMPLNPDGTSHFATCPEAEKHRKAKLSEQQAEQFKFTWLNGVYYKLRGRELVPAKDVVDWGIWFEDVEGRTLGDDRPFPGVQVSTVCLGVDHDHGLHNGPPRVFETRVFGGPLGGETSRVATYDEAFKEHCATLARVVARGT